MIGILSRKAIFSFASRVRVVVKPYLALTVLLTFMGTVAPQEARANSLSMGGGTLSWSIYTSTSGCNYSTTYTLYQFYNFSFTSSAGVVSPLSGSAYYYQWYGGCASGTPQGASPSSIVMYGPTFYITFYPGSSGSGSATYTAFSPAATPTFSPVAGTYSGAQKVTISDTTPGAIIYYTTDGTTPTTSSTQYTGLITVISAETIEAIATANYYLPSAVGTAVYTILPSITSLSPTSGVAGTPVTITGTNFITLPGEKTVTFNGTAATSITSWGATTIVAEVPTGATSGNVVVIVGGLSSNGVPFTVTPTNPVTTSVSLTTSGSTSVYGGLVAFTATINAPLIGSSLTFSDNFNNVPTTLGTVTISGTTGSDTTATFTTSTLAVGTHSITARFAGNLSYGLATSNTVTQTVKSPATSVVTCW